MALQEELETQGNYLFRYRGTLPLIILVLGILVFVINFKQHNMFPVNQDVFKFACLLVSLAGLIIRIIAVGYSPVNTSGRNTEGQLADSLNSTGIYSTVRHPLYLGNFLMWLGVGMLTQNVWFIFLFILMYWLYYERIMFAEEQFLRKKFADVYVDWSLKTPAFVPSFGNYQKPVHTFSWKKVLKKEKDGFVSVFLVMFFFDFLGQYLQNHSIVPEKNFWFYSLIVSFVIYSILKILKSYSTFLDEKGR